MSTINTVHAYVFIQIHPNTISQKTIVQWQFACIWNIILILLRTIRAYWSKRRVVPPVLFRTNYYSIEILHGVTAIILTYHPHHAKLQVLPIILKINNDCFMTDLFSICTCAVHDGWKQITRHDENLRCPLVEFKDDKKLHLLFALRISCVSDYAIYY